MPDSMPFPYLDPSQIPGYLDVQRKQQLAQMLIQGTQQSAQTPADWNSMRVVPKRSALANVATLAAALMAGKAMKGANLAQANYLQGMTGGGAPGSPAPPAPPMSDGVPQVPPPLIRDPNVDPMGSQWSGSIPLAAVHPDGPAYGLRSAPASSAMLSQGTQNPMVPGGMSLGTANQMLAMLGPEKYAETLLTPRYKPAEIESQLRSAGIDPRSPQGQALQRAVLAKAATNLENVRPEGTLFDANAGQPVFTAPGHGMQTTWTPQGPVQSTMPGAPAAQAEMTGAETAGRTMNSPAAIPNKAGGTDYGYPPDAIGLPPALRGLAGPGAPGITPARVAPVQAPQIAGGAMGMGSGAASNVRAPLSPGDPWASIPKLAIQSGVGSPGAYQQALYSETAKKHMALVDQYGAASNLGDQRIAYNTEAAGSLAKADTGPLAEQFNYGRGVLAQFGLLPQNQLDKLQDTTEANKYLINGALRNGKDLFGSRFTQSEVGLMLSHAAPGVSMFKPAIRELMLQDSLKAGYDKQKASDYSRFASMGGDPAQFEQWYARTNPLQKFATENRAPYKAMLDQAETSGAGSKQGSSPSLPTPAMNQLPPAAQHAGRVIRDTQTGQLLQSNGSSWVPKGAGASGSY